MNRFIANTGKRFGNSHHSVPTRCKTFLKDEFDFVWYRVNVLVDRLESYPSLTDASKLT